MEAQSIQLLPLQYSYHLVLQYMYSYHLVWLFVSCMYATHMVDMCHCIHSDELMIALAQKNAIQNLPSKDFCKECTFNSAPVLYMCSLPHVHIWNFTSFFKMIAISVCFYKKKNDFKMK